MPRYFLYLEYDGSYFAGWQIQPDAITVQGELNKALQIIYKTEFAVYGSGRTDAGVHASHQVAHVDIPKNIHRGKFIRSMNALMHNQCKVWDIVEVSDEAHARFDALDRSYVYKIITNPSPLRENTAWYLNQKLDLSLLTQSADLLKNISDFTPFSKPNPTNMGSTFCKVSQAEWKQVALDEFHFHITANRFLHHMVRFLVGSMFKVSTQTLSLETFMNALEGKETNFVNLKAPAHGLCLTNVNYPDSCFI